MAIFPVASAGSGQRDDRDAIDAESDARLGALDGFECAPRSVIHRRRAAAGRRAGLCFSF